MWNELISDFLLKGPLFKNLLFMVITIIVAFIIIKCTSHLLRRAQKLWDLDLTLLQVLNDVVKYTVIFLGLTIILSEFGVNVSGIVLSLGIVGIAVGFAARDTLANFIAGLFILADKGFKVGDIIEISDKEGKVSKMGFRITTLITADNRIINVPNSSFSKNLYVNLTAAKKRRVDLEVTIPYDLNLESTVRALKSTTRGVTGVLETPPPEVQIKKLSESGVEAVITFWISNPWDIGHYKTSVAKEVKKILVDENA